MDGEQLSDNREVVFGISRIAWPLNMPKFVDKQPDEEEKRRLN
jgi:hypothetical protein